MFLTLQSVVTVNAVDGGEVDINVGITFKEALESTYPSTSSTGSKESSSEDVSITNPQKKPQGKLPSTGEELKKYILLGLIFLLLFIYWVVNNGRKERRLEKK